MHDDQKWPDSLLLVRHGQSAGNVARDEAHSAKLHDIELSTRDVDVPLSDLGIRQAEALGHWFRRQPLTAQPSVVLCSPYRRARQTTEVVLESAGLSKLTPVIDERMREKEFGMFDRLTTYGIKAKYPELHEARRALGKFYFRPPGGESWCDVILRLRSLLDTMTRDYRRERLLLVSHQVVVNCFRYLLERMTEDQVLENDSKHDIANCSVTSYQFDPSAGRRGKLVPKLLNFVAPLEEEGAPVTRTPDVPVGPK